MPHVITCSVCGTETFDHTKGLCKVCYARERQRSPAMKQKMKEYREKNKEKLKTYYRDYKRLQRANMA